MSRERPEFFQPDGLVHHRNGNCHLADSSLRAQFYLRQGAAESSIPVYGRPARSRAGPNCLSAVGLVSKAPAGSTSGQAPGQ
jgi:hypothetical protein